MSYYLLVHTVVVHLLGHTVVVHLIVHTIVVHLLVHTIVVHLLGHTVVVHLLGHTVVVHLIVHTVVVHMKKKTNKLTTMTERGREDLLLFNYYYYFLTMSFTKRCRWMTYHLIVRTTVMHTKKPPAQSITVMCLN